MRLFWLFSSYASAISLLAPVNNFVAEQVLNGIQLMLSRINESPTISDEAKLLIASFSADINENVTPAGLVEYINRFSLSSVEANGFTEEIEEAALALLRIFQNLRPFLRLDVDSSSSLAFIMELIQDSLVFYNSLDLAFELSELDSIDFSIRLSEFALMFRNEYYQIIDDFDRFQKADACKDPIKYLTAVVDVAQNVARSALMISDSLCDALEIYVANTEICGVLNQVEEHVWLEYLFDADDSVAEIKALDSLLNGAISTQIQALPFFACSENK
ncbi:Oidioi.mRNA.OKI2018_I69.PAR.g9668.t1.cds [Oikopleura dioica]|uniref:Oidioi.mRNA.OKI2018_I69.PAR.g9668.t1.cds n=1 Tax=Oikopleura dioica TaxID=34765 RepID=A0ABN7RR33_OIKDI|nr:Oidioi.mRNA.OKI2018_I69.PAR.g9668.t1.cds [Oikopleura dioica]